MFTTILAYVTAIAGLVMVIAGLWGGSILLSERSEIRVPLRYYAISIGMIATGVGLIGIAQALRLLIVIVEKGNAQYLWVATTGNDSNDCTSAATPCLTVQGAVDKAPYAQVSTISIAAGTYAGEINVKYYRYVYLQGPLNEPNS